MKSTIPFIVIALSVGLYYMYISPMWAEVGELSAKKAEYENILNKTKDIVAQRDASISAYNSISEDDIKKLNDIVPATFNSVAVGHEIDTIAGKYNMRLTAFTTNALASLDLQPDPTVASDSGSQFYKTKKISLKVAGSFGSFVSFLNDVESSLHLVDIKKVIVDTTPGKNPNDVNIEYSIEANTYSLQ